MIRSLNTDKPYARFVQEQIAGDVLFPDEPDGIVGLGFIAAGPWDFIGHVEVSETKLDGKVARNLDRDDMVAGGLNTFCSLTVQCARCHDHKFDAITQEQYYGLQAVFAAVDRVDRKFDTDPVMAQRRRALTTSRDELVARRTELDVEVLIRWSLSQPLAGHGYSGHAPPKFGVFQLPGFPGMGAWVSYGLGSMNDNLPTFVVLPDHRGLASNGPKNWASAFLPASSQGTTIFPERENPIDDLAPKAEFITADGDRDGLQLLNRLNQRHQAQRLGDSRLEARIRSYELAAAMQLSAPEALDISGEAPHILRMYGLDRVDATYPDTINPAEEAAYFGRKCLIARR